MDIQLYNSRTGKKARFVPQGKVVSVYVCGPTVYGPPHIGNARPAVMFDILVRLLKAMYPGRVRYVRNITDVDDKLIAAAKAESQSVHDLAVRYEAQYNDDMAALGCLPPDITPRATEHIAQMHNLIHRLLVKDFAYEAQGHVLFDVNKYAAYGTLARRNPDEMLAGARVEVAPYKRADGDFILWKPSQGNELGWDSPWGRGRPGWHTECVAMIKTSFGGAIDIHGGGQDLLFPHHENEAAQYECLHGHALANIWMHNAMITMQGDKMAKSQGNIRLVRGLLEAYMGDILRLAMCLTHYRHPLELGDAALAQASTVLTRLYRDLRIPQETSLAGPAEDRLDNYEAIPEPLREIVRTGLCDDLNLPSVIAQIFMQLRRRRPNRDVAANVRAQLRWLWQFLGFRLDLPLDMARINDLLAQRSKAREAKDYACADRLRDELERLGIEVEDVPNGESNWRIMAKHLPKQT